MKKKWQAITTVIVIVAALIGAHIWEKVEYKQKYTVDEQVVFENNNSLLTVHYIDVDQADSMFISLPNGKTMLIDAGGNANGKNVVSYIKSSGVTTIDYVVGTHPHEDHIGGLDDVIYAFNIGEVYMPKVSLDTKSFEDVLTALDKKGEIVTTAKSGVTIYSDDELKIEIIGPVSDSYEELNNYSAVVKLTYGEVEFLFMGDAEKESELELLDVASADVLKVSHHGSSTSSVNSFIKKVNPKIAVIPVGQDNDYSHPSKEVLKRIEKTGAKIYRTDLNGTVVITTDGEKISCSTEK